MGRFTAILLFLAQLIAISLACFHGGSSSGHPYGLDLSRDTVLFPRYDSKDRTVGLGLEHRLNENTKFGADIGVDQYGNTRGGISIGYEFKRSIEHETAHDIDISRKLFKVLDINGDDQLDVKEWFDEGGQVRSFSDMIGDHDNNSDEMISLEEFLVIHVDPAAIGAIEQMIRSDQNQ